MDKTKKTTPEANTEATISAPAQKPDITINCSLNEIPVVLETPIVRDGETINVVYIREAKGGEMRGCAMTDILTLDPATIERLLPRVSRPVIYKHEFAQMRQRDAMHIGGAISSFFGDLKQWSEIRAERISELEALKTSGATQYAPLNNFYKHGLSVNPSLKI